MLRDQWAVVLRTTHNDASRSLSFTGASVTVVLKKNTNLFKLFRRTNMEYKLKTN